MTRKPMQTIMWVRTSPGRRVAKLLVLQTRPEVQKLAGSCALLGVCMSCLCVKCRSLFLRRRSNAPSASRRWAPCRADTAAAVIPGCGRSSVAGSDKRRCCSGAVSAKRKRQALPNAASRVQHAERTRMEVRQPMITTRLCSACSGADIASSSNVRTSNARVRSRREVRSIQCCESLSRYVLESAFTTQYRFSW